MYFILYANSLFFNPDKISEFYPKNWIDLDSIECIEGVCTAWSRNFVDVGYDVMRIDKKFEVLCAAFDSEILVDSVDATMMSDGGAIAVDEDAFRIDENLVEPLRIAVCTHMP